jgi:hypothetical protein
MILFPEVGKECITDFLGSAVFLVSVSYLFIHRVWLTYLSHHILGQVEAGNV